jgi:hypothetical protein
MNPDRAYFMTMSSVSNQTWTMQVGGSAATSNADPLDHKYNVSAYENQTSADGVLTGNWPAVRFIFSGNGTGTFVMIG